MSPLSNIDYFFNNLFKKVVVFYVLYLLNKKKIRDLFIYYFKTVNKIYTKFSFYTDAFVYINAESQVNNLILKLKY
jgi:hypothetical protein